MKIANYATTEVTTVGPSDSIDKAICLMEEHGFHHLVVTVDGKMVGIVSDRDVLVSTGWMLSVERMTHGAGGRGHVVGPTRIEQIMTREVVYVPDDATPREAAFLMLDRKVSAMPVVHEGRLAGIVTETDFLKWLDDNADTNHDVRYFARREVRELMRANVITLGPQASLGEVVDLFRRRRIRHVPVVAGEVLRGIISDRDVRRALGAATVHDMQLQDEGRLDDMAGPRAAADIMHRKVITTGPAASLRDAVRLMLANRIHSLPVLYSEKLLGIVTQTDFVKAIARERLL